MGVSKDALEVVKAIKGHEEWTINSVILDILYSTSRFEKIG